MDMEETGKLESLDPNMLQLQDASPFALKLTPYVAKELFSQWLSLPDTSRLRLDQDPFIYIYIDFEEVSRPHSDLKNTEQSKNKNDQTSWNNNIYYSPLNNLIDPQGFVEKLFARLQKCNERFEVKMMMLKVIARTVGLHQLILLNFYPYLQKYIQPHQRDVTNLLAAAVQACHDMVPPDAVEPLCKQIVNQFVHDRSRPEAITVGINAVREICLRIPLVTTTISWFLDICILLIYVLTKYILRIQQGLV
ncbi:Calcium-binding EF-hand family protein [Trifolium repens]|nr:Calcium-binding EF-hand family protein [Trifolium repens]